MVETTSSQPRVIEPKWWTGTPFTDPASFTLDASEIAPEALPDAMRNTYEAVGLVHVTRTGLTEVEDMRDVARHVLGQTSTYDGGANPRGHIAPNVYEIGAPITAGLQYHHEMAYNGSSYRAISFLAKSALPHDPTIDPDHIRGATFVSDSIAATDALLATPFGQKLRDLGVCYHRNLTDRDAFIDRVEEGVYNHWQKSFQTDDPHIAAQRARDQRLAVEWADDGTMLTRFYAGAYEFDPGTERNVLYSSLADHGMWFDTWPLVSHLPYEQRPLDMTFGDGTAFTDDERQEWIDLYDRFGTPIRWQQGDVAVIDNYRFAHGRDGVFERDGESRTLGVLLGEPYSRVGVRPDAW